MATKMIIEEDISKQCLKSFIILINPNKSITFNNIENKLPNLEINKFMIGHSFNILRLEK